MDSLRLSYWVLRKGLHLTASDASASENQPAIYNSRKMRKDLPPELLAEILSRLPAEDLHHLKRVHKLWANLINSRHFVKLHLKRTTLSRNNRSLLISTNNSIFSINLETGRATNLNFPFRCSDPRFSPHIIGTCDGLLCYVVGMPYEDYKHNILVCNMTAKEYLKLPTYCSSDQYASTAYFVLYGFGHDFVRDDYKLVRIIRFRFGDMNNKTQVYSLRDKFWKTLVASCPHFLMGYGSSGVHVNGALHWVVNRKPDCLSEFLVIAFDLSTEDYSEVPFPDYPPHEFPSLIPEISVAGMEGKLCMLFDYVGLRVDLWVMAEYGNKHSWYKLVSLLRPQIISYFRFVAPLAISNSNSSILLRGYSRRFFWYDMENLEVRDFAIPEVEINPESRCGICLSSLVKLDARMYSKVSKIENWKEEKNKRVRIFKGLPRRRGACSLQEARVMRLPNSIEELKNIAVEELRYGMKDSMLINEAGTAINSIEMIKDDDTLFLVEKPRRMIHGVYFPRVKIFKGKPRRKGAFFMQEGRLMGLPNSFEELMNIAVEELGYDTTDLMLINEAGAVIDSIEMINDDDTLFMVEEFRRVSMTS